MDFWGKLLIRFDFDLSCSNQTALTGHASRQARWATIVSVSPQIASRLVHLLFHSSPVCPAHTQTTLLVCDICSSRLHLCTACIITKCLKNNMANGRMAILSPLTAVNAFVHYVRWADAFTSGGRCTMQNALMHGYVTMRWHVPLKSTPSHRGIWIPSNMLPLARMSLPPNGISSNRPRVCVDVIIVMLTITIIVIN